MNSTQHIFPRKRIAIVAHDNKKNELVEWARNNKELQARHDLCATGTDWRHDRGRQH
jgi:methylglyoxal synthase